METSEIIEAAFDPDRVEVVIAVFEDGKWMAAGASGISLAETSVMLERSAKENGKTIADIHVVPWFI